MKDPAAKEPIRVVVVDDSPTVREMLVALLQSARDMQVVGIGQDGEEAVRLVKRMRPDVVTLDVRMPRLDGLAATRQIMREVPTPIVIVSGTLMAAEADITFEALRAGALTVVHTPGLADPEGCTRFVQAVRLMAGVPVVHHWGREASMVPLAPAVAGPAARLRQTILVVGIAASTGGPGALATILRRLPVTFPLPLLIVQHVSRGFVAGLADWLNGETPLRVGLADHGDPLEPGVALLAPDDYHLQVNVDGVVELSREPAYRGLRPSANHLFRSLAGAYGPRALGIVLTGMGDDGAQGLAALRLAGGTTIAQEQTTCVVYGMPGEAVAAGAVERILSPDEISLALNQLAAEPASF